jgi:CHASE3 domain sensor protein
LLVFVASGVVSYINTRILSQDAWWVSHTHQVLLALEDVMAAVTEAETEQRGYLITEDEKYLALYTTAVARVDEQIGEVERLTQDNSRQQARIPMLRSRVAAKLRLPNLALAERR